ncbi:MAG: glycosyltransferase family 4 protein [Alphaproteobacteria bacterium]
MPKIIFFVTEDWAFCSHRLPVARKARDIGFDVYVVARESSCRSKIEKEGFNFVSLGINRGGINPFKELKTLIDVIKIYAREKPDIVHHVALKPILYGSMAALITGVKSRVNAFTGLGTIFTGNDLIRKTVRLFLKPLLKFILTRKNTALIVQNDDDFAVFQKLGIKDLTKIEGSGIDCSYYTSQEEPSGEIIKAALVARMLKEKGVIETVEAAKILKNDNVKIKIVFVGDTDNENPSAIPEELLKKWDSDGLIEWQGKRNDILNVWKENHIAILPSWREGLPKSLLEASACAKPMIASDAVGCRELVKNNINGLLVPLKSPSDLADALKKLSQDAPLRQKMGKAARQMAENIYDEKIIAEKTAKVYKRLCNF